jgi:hypothetical protein
VFAVVASPVTGPNRRLSAIFTCGPTNRAIDVGSARNTGVWVSAASAFGQGAPRRTPERLREVGDVSGVHQLFVLHDRLRRRPAGNSSSGERRAEQRECRPGQ